MPCETVVSMSIFQTKSNTVRGSIVVSIPACHAGNRGSIPRRGVILFFSFQVRFSQFTLQLRHQLTREREKVIYLTSKL